MNEYLLILNETPAGPILSFLFGLIWGSFFNVVIYRLPRDQSLWRKPSHCTKCRKKIPWRWNIPVFGYLWLRGRCGFCHKKFSVEYPLVEFGTGLLFLVVFFQYGATARFLCYVVFCSALLVLSVIDLHHRIIPDEISLAGIPLGLLATFVTHDISWQDSLGGILFGGGLFFAVAWLYERMTKREGLGGGDVKLLAMLGAWLGAESILFIIVISSAIGSLIGVYVMITQRKNLQTAIPFGPFLAGAAALYLFFGDAIKGLLLPPLP